VAVRPIVVVELGANAKYARELTDGAVYVDSCELAADSVCDLVVRGAMDEAVFDARVVPAPAGGAALELLGFCPAMKQQLEFLIAATPTTQRVEKLESEYDNLLRDVGAVDLGIDDEPSAAQRRGWIEGDTPWPDERHARAVLDDDDGGGPPPSRRTPWLEDAPLARPVARGTDARQLTQSEEAHAPWRTDPQPSELSAWAEAIPASRRERSAWAESRPPGLREPSQWGADAPQSELSPWATGDDDDLAVPIEAQAELSVDDLDDDEDDDAPAMIHAGRLVDDTSEVTLDEPLPLPTLEPLTEPVALLDPEDLIEEPAATPDPLDALDLDDTEEDEGDEGGHAKAALTVHERLRRLSLPQQLKKAHTGELQERIVLERMYGKTVWEPLLRNPRLTAPEVARIARMGQLPKPLIELIVANGAWLQVPEVRRALLSNPRLGSDQIMRVLRMLPKHELRLAAVQTAYSHAVRDVAKRMLKDT
jgi:hypothetical protein